LEPTISSPDREFDVFYIDQGYLENYENDIC